MQVKQKKVNLKQLKTNLYIYVKQRAPLTSIKKLSNLIWKFRFFEAVKFLGVASSSEDVVKSFVNACSNADLFSMFEGSERSWFK